MPTYDYRCKACGQELEVVQSFSDDPLTTCDTCGGELRKLFGAPGIAFKGSGFYKTDSRPASTSSSSSSASSGSGSTGGGSDPTSGNGTSTSGTASKKEPAGSATSSATSS